MLRALRVGKTTLALLETDLHYYLDDKILVSKNSVFDMLTKKPAEIKARAIILQKELQKKSIRTEIIESQGYCGGGALPGEEIQSYCVRLKSGFDSNKKKSDFAEKMYYGLMKHSSPIIGVLKQGYIDFNLLTIPDEEILDVAKIITEIYKDIMKT